jgi:hypothetical protein
MRACSTPVGAPSGCIYRRAAGSGERHLSGFHVVEALYLRSHGRGHPRHHPPANRTLPWRVRTGRDARGLAITDVDGGSQGAGAGPSSMLSPADSRNAHLRINRFPSRWRCPISMRRTEGLDPCADAPWHGMEEWATLRTLATLHGRGPGQGDKRILFKGGSACAAAPESAPSPTFRSDRECGNVLRNLPRWDRARPKYARAPPPPRADRNRSCL